MMLLGSIVYDFHGMKSFAYLTGVYVIFVFLGLVSYRFAFGGRRYEAPALQKAGVLSVKKRTLKMGPAMSRTLFAGGSGAVGILPGTFAMFFVGAWISRLDTQTEVIFAAITGCVLAFIAGYVMPMGWGVYEFIRRYQRETGIQLLVDGD